MGQTIICEYLLTWESTGTQPDPTAFGFDGLYSMLEECQDTMLKLGTAANEYKRTLDAQHGICNRELAAKDGRIDRLLTDLEHADKRIVDLLQLNQSLERQVARLLIEQELDAMEQS